MSDIVLTSNNYVGYGIDKKSIFGYKFIKKSTIFQCLLLLVSLRALENALRGTIFYFYIILCIEMMH
jgi:hypothetical protein